MTLVERCPGCGFAVEVGLDADELPEPGHFAESNVMLDAAIRWDDMGDGTFSAVATWRNDLGGEGFEFVHQCAPPGHGDDDWPSGDRAPRSPSSPSGTRSAEADPTSN